MSYLVIGLLSFAILIGIYLLTYVLQNKETPKGVVFLHGFLASCGLVLLIIYASFYQLSLFGAIVIFVLAAMGGLFLLFKDLTGKSIPKWMALGHGSVALLAFILLIFLLFLQ